MHPIVEIARAVSGAGPTGTCGPRSELAGLSAHPALEAVPRRARHEELGGHDCAWRLPMEGIARPAAPGSRAASAKRVQLTGHPPVYASATALQCLRAWLYRLPAAGSAQVDSGTWTALTPKPTVRPAAAVGRPEKQWTARPWTDFAARPVSVFCTSVDSIFGLQCDPVLIQVRDRLQLDWNRLRACARRNVQHRCRKQLHNDPSSELGAPTCRHDARCVEHFAHCSSEEIAQSHPLLFRDHHLVEVSRREIVRACPTSPHAGIRHRRR